VARLSKILLRLAQSGKTHLARQRLSVIEVALDDYELVASCSCNGIGGTKSVSQSLGHLHEDAVPGSVAVGVIHELEPIQIQRQDRKRTSVRLL
jgi:hypothetical protein